MEIKGMRAILKYSKPYIITADLSFSSEGL